MLLKIKSAYNLAVLALSTVAMGIVIDFVTETNKLIINSSPKAMLNLKEILLPPLTNLQIFVFCFDFFVTIYYVYHWPIWNKFKKKFVYYQYEAQPVEK